VKGEAGGQRDNADEANPDRVALISAWKSPNSEADGEDQTPGNGQPGKRDFEHSASFQDEITLLATGVLTSFAFGTIFGLFVAVTTRRRPKGVLS
jgi:hypothetical protein